MMNLKYYLRGLGVGIIVTALIMGITVGGKKETLSSEEIKERARALGMVEESSVLADAAVKQPVEPEEQEKEPIMTATPDQTSEPTMEPSPVPTESPTAIPTESPTAVPTKEPAKIAEAVEEPTQNSAPVSIQINRGDGSLTVSRKLEEAGLVASAADFDLYLCQNGYDKRLNVGTFEIPAGADTEQIARILAGPR